MIKKGITITTLAISIIIISILATVITSSIYSTISFSKLSTWANELRYIEDTVKEEVMKSSATNILKEDISIDVSSLSQEQISEQFEGELITDSLVDLKVIDLGLLKITDTVYGNQNTPNDVYAYSEITGRVYYVEGIEISGKTYFTVASNLLDMFGIEKDGSSLSTIVFEPSIIGYTNEPITVKVKVPNTFTNVSITTTNDDIIIGDSVTVGNTYEYTVNTTNVTGNYTITVTYTNGTNNYTSTYDVNGYDNEAPLINAVKNNNNEFIITVNDNVKILKYEDGEINPEQIESYFEYNGKKIVNSKFKTDKKIRNYTIYVQDYAGNYSYQVVENYMIVNIGDYIEYDVEYADMFVPENKFSTLNGWRIVKTTNNLDGTFSDTVIMSTGIPARFDFLPTADDNHKQWWVTDQSKLADFYNFLTSFGDGNYNGYNENSNNKALQASAGLFYNFGDISFKYSDSLWQYNSCRFTKIVSNGTVYDGSNNSSLIKTGNELFNLFGVDKADIRLLTLPELNTFIRNNDIDSTSTINDSNDIWGLYKLSKIVNVPNMNNFTSYSSDDLYYLASPYPRDDYTIYLIRVKANGTISSESGMGYGIRPIIAFKDNINIKFVDANNNGVPEIQVLN